MLEPGSDDAIATTDDGANVAAGGLEFTHDVYVPASPQKEVDIEAQAWSEQWGVNLDIPPAVFPQLEVASYFYWEVVQTSGTACSRVGARPRASSL